MTQEVTHQDLEDVDSTDAFTAFNVLIIKNYKTNNFFPVSDSTVSCMIDSYNTGVRHVTGNDQDYLRKIPRVVVQKSALL